MASTKNSPHKYAVIISWSGDPGDEVFIADIPELPGCTAHGDTHEEALANAHEAINLWLDTCEEDDVPPPTPGIVSEIMRSEYVNLEMLDIAEPRPDILRAQIDLLCQESLRNCITAIQSEFD